jgi:hypothetical protein
MNLFDPKSSLRLVAFERLCRGVIYADAGAILPML